LLVKMDIASMAHSLEARSPLLDREVFEFGASLPARFKVRGGVGKWLLRRAVADDLPADLVARPKMGFAVPLERWFRGPLSGIARDVLLDRRTAERGLLQIPAVRRLLDEHQSGRALHHSKLWTLLMLELWFRTWMDAAPQPAAA
ncbi:MAG TPA: asparagine synthase-related protein, partial [Vicinamibacterales bacterium]|nr:asparagine synthase-related protein [Vicinamibacterales bacterium]